jgi:uncharacterized protein YciI
MAETTHKILFYEYVPDIAERRGPHRPAHLEHIAQEKASGRMILGGALGDPLHGGVFVFRDTDPAAIETYVQGDPYVAAGLVAAWRIEPYMVV